MSDYCYLEITFLKKDKERLSELFGGSADGGFWDGVNDEDEVKMSVYVYQANYGFYECRNTAAAEGLIFCGHHDAGGSYDAQLFASWGKRQFESYAVGKTAAVRLHDTGSVIKSDLDDARNYLSAIKNVTNFFKSQVGNGNTSGQPA